VAKCAFSAHIPPLRSIAEKGEKDEFFCVRYCLNMLFTVLRHLDTSIQPVTDNQEMMIFTILITPWAKTALSSYRLVRQFNQCTTMWQNKQII